MLRVREGHGLAALVYLQRHQDRQSFFAIGMQVSHHCRTTFHSDKADAPWRAFAEMHIGRQAHGRFGKQGAASRRIYKKEFR
jgi:hypothetical protein